MLLGGIVFQYYITALPDLEQPITLSSASTSSNSGTISASFRDAEGYEFYFGVRRDPDADPATFPAFYIRNPELVPYVYWPSLGGPDERALLRLLEGWIDRNVAPELKAKLEEAEAGNGDAAGEDIAAVYEIYRSLRARHRQ